MARKNLIGSIVAFVISDPWEFGTECGIGPFFGIIKDKNSGKALIYLDKTISYSGTNYSVCVCTSRHQGKDIDDILNGEKVAANMMLISTKATSFSDVDKQSQNKSQAVIGTIEQA